MYYSYVRYTRWRKLDKGYKGPFCEFILQDKSFKKVKKYTKTDENTSKGHNKPA